MSWEPAKCADCGDSWGSYSAQWASCTTWYCPPCKARRDAEEEAAAPPVSRSRIHSLHQGVFPGPEWVDVERPAVPRFLLGEGRTNVYYLAGFDGDVAVYREVGR